MAKLYFKYGSMGSSKTAQALITKYNYEENGMHVWLIKPAADERDGAIHPCAAASVWRPLPRSFRRTATFTSSTAAAKRRTSSSSTSASS